MVPRRVVIGLCLAASLLGAGALSAQTSTLTGRVVDASTLAPLEGVLVSIAISDTRHRAFERAVTHRHVTDAHLLALAVSNDGSLATFDRGTRDLVPSGLNPESIVLLVP